jgi:xylulokinase
MREWSAELIELLGINKDVFPKLLPSGSFLGEVSDEAALVTSLAPGTPVFLGGHDYYCAALAVGAFVPDIVMDITGTFEMVLSSSDHLNLSRSYMEAGLTVESHVASDVFGIMGFNVSGDMLEWFRKNYCEKEMLLAGEAGKSDWEFIIENALKSTCGSKGVFFLPHFSGSFCPVMDGRSQGAFVGLSNYAGKGDMVRAVIEGLNFQFKDMLLEIERPMGLSAQKIVSVGGATKNRFWMQNKADITGRIIEVPEIEEATALGAAMLAGIGLGVYKNEKDAASSCSKKSKIYYPEAKMNQKYVEYFEIYKKIYPALKEVNGDIFNSFRKE